MDQISFKRQLSLQLLEESDLSWKPNFPWWFNISPARSRVLLLKELGAVLTGSMALKGYKWSGKKVINRKSNDWDFILTRSQLLEFFKREKIYDKSLDSKFYTINKSLVTIYDSYSTNDDDNTYVLNGRLDLIIVDTLEDYGTYNGWNVHNFHKIWESKCKLNEEERTGRKHFDDLNYLKLNFLI